MQSWHCFSWRWWLRSLGRRCFWSFLGQSHGFLEVPEWYNKCRCISRSWRITSVEPYLNSPTLPSRCQIFGHSRFHVGTPLFQLSWTYGCRIRRSCDWGDIIDCLFVDGWVVSAQAPAEEVESDDEQERHRLEALHQHLVLES